MTWWEDTEARARRFRGAAALTLTLQQRLVGVGVDPDLAALPAYDLANLTALCADLVMLVDGLLITRDGDLPALRRQAYLLQRWGERTHQWTRTTVGAFNRLLDSLELDPADLAERDEPTAAAPPGQPQEEGKREGRYRHWHLLYERLELKFAAAGIPAHAGRGLARSIARIYEEALGLIRSVWNLERDSQPRFRQLARTLLEVNTSWHFDLGPNHLGWDPIEPGSAGWRGLQTWLFLAFGNEGFASGA